MPTAPLAQFGGDFTVQRARLEPFPIFGITPAGRKGRTFATSTSSGSVAVDPQQFEVMARLAGGVRVGKYGGRSLPVQSRTYQNFPRSQRYAPAVGLYGPGPDAGMIPRA